MQNVLEKEKEQFVAERSEAVSSCSRSIYWYVKRFLDVAVAAVMLLLLLIPFGIIAILIKLDDGGPVLFTQIRIGRNGKPFQIYKFRTMSLDAPYYLPTELWDKSYEYVTKVGSFLRRTSLDELPQVLNILKGDMSWISPRPLIPNEGIIHNLRQQCGVYAVRPGLTGLAQICGRDEVDRIQKASLDTQYVRNFGLFQDLRILFVTIPQILTGAGVCENENGDIE